MFVLAAPQPPVWIPSAPDQPALPGMLPLDLSSERSATPGTNQTTRTDQRIDNPAVFAAKLVSSFALLVVEVWQGRRPGQQLTQTMPAHLAGAVRADASLGAAPLIVRVHATPLSTSVIEGCAVIALPSPLVSMTLRLERGLSMWWCSHYHVIRPPEAQRRAHR